MRWIVPLLIAIAPAQALQAESADRLSYMLITGDSSSSSGSWHSDDFRRAEAFRAGNAPLLYVRDHGVAYVIRDAATLRRAEAIMAPQQELGRRQGALGRQQGALGRRQGELGREQGELGRQQAALGRQQARLAKLAQPQFRALVADAIRRGVAQRVN